MKRTFAWFVGPVIMSDNFTRMMEQHTLDILLLMKSVYVHVTSHNANSCFFIKHPIQEIKLWISYDP